MQVTSLFATFFTFLALVAPTLSMQIAVPTNVTTGNTTITCAAEATDPDGSLTFFLVRNTTVLNTLAENITKSGPLAVNIPANATGDGWRILAKTANGIQVGLSPAFFIASGSPHNGGARSAGPVVGGVVAGVLVLSLLVFAFVYMRRRRHSSRAPVFNLETGFPPPPHQNSFDSTTSTVMAESGSKAIEMEKIQWERQLEEQFARARAATPDIRGDSPMLRGTSPMPMPIAPQRAARRNPSY
ncbi:hypothetical protein DFH06DRAFT_529869 [Mycena polygramma]|nr:hypothetical protein DFH06DRAFT_529869 [Mycena polygramma]